MTDVLMPALSPTMEEGTLAKPTSSFRRDGDGVSQLSLEEQIRSASASRRDGGLAQFASAATVLTCVVLFMALAPYVAMGLSGTLMLGLIGVLILLPLLAMALLPVVGIWLAFYLLGAIGLTARRWAGARRSTGTLH